MAQPDLESLSLHKEEEEGFCFDFEDEEDDQVDLRWCLIGRFLCDRSIHFNSMKVRMADLWKPVKGVTIKEAQARKFLFHFNHPLDMEAVIKGGPWTFDNNMLILERAQLGMQLEHIPLHHVNMWVQVHDLPMGFMKEKVGIKLANYIGVFVEYDKNNNSSFWRQHMRIRVKIDVRNPLKKETKVKDKEGAWCTVKFKYEKLGVFCFVCGIMGHGENKCEILFAKEQDDGVREWSAELRADLRRQGGRITSWWLREETGGRAEHGGSQSADQSSFPGGASNAGPTAAEVASSFTTPTSNRSIDNQAAIIARQHQSLVINDLSNHPTQNIPSDPTIMNHSNPNNQNVETIVISPNLITTDNLNYTCPTVLPFPPNNQFRPLIPNKHATENHKSPLLPYQALIFSSQPINPDKKNMDQLTLNPTPRTDPILTRTSFDKKTRNTKLKPNPTRTHPATPIGHEISDDNETQIEKKRRRADEVSTSKINVIATEHFLTAGPGSQACQDK
jgi:14-3-3 protein epsilon